MKKIIFILLVAAMPLCAQNFWETTTLDFHNSDYPNLLIGDHRGNIFAGLRGGGIYRSSDHGAIWMHIDSGLIRDQATNILAFAIDSSGNIFIVTGAGVYRSTNNGDVWLPSDTSIQYINTASITISPGGDIYMWHDAPRQGLYRSTNDGTTWESLNDSITVPNFGTQAIGAFSITVTKQGIILIGDYNGIYSSSDTGTTWVLSTGAADIHYPNALFISREGYIYAGAYSDYVYRSSNGGAIWQNTGGAPSTNSIVEDASGYLYTSSTTGVYRLTNGGGNWEQINSGLTNVQMTALGIDSAGYLYAGTTNYGIYRSMQTTTAVQEQGATPTGFTLEQNYPNPAASATTILFSTAAEGTVTLKIYNALGNEVATLISGRLAAGTHTAVWETQALPQGMYYYQLQANGKTQTKKIVLVK